MSTLFFIITISQLEGTESLFGGQREKHLPSDEILPEVDDLADRDVHPHLDGNDAEDERLWLGWACTAAVAGRNR